MRPVSISPRNSVEVKEAMFKANTLLLPLDIQRDFPLGSAIGFRPNSYQLNSAIQVSLLNKRGVFDGVRNVWHRISTQTLWSPACYNRL